MSDTATHSERRQDARLPMARPVKVLCTTTARRYAGQLVNLSAGGALVEIDHPVGLVSGQEIRLGVAWTRQDVVIPTEGLLEARVVRNLGLRGRQQIAMAFALRQPLAATA